MNAGRSHDARREKSASRSSARFASAAQKASIFFSTRSRAYRSFASSGSGKRNRMAASIAPHDEIRRYGPYSTRQSLGDLRSGFMKPMGEPIAVVSANA